VANLIVDAPSQVENLAALARAAQQRAPSFLLQKSRERLRFPQKALPAL
jgi:hypothetical protein